MQNISLYGARRYTRDELFWGPSSESLSRSMVVSGLRASSMMSALSLLDLYYLLYIARTTHIIKSLPMAGCLSATWILNIQKL